jgi:hypothetical protein
LHRSADGRYLADGPFFPIDPDLLVERLGGLVPMDDEDLNAFWHHLSVDPAEILRTRTRQKMYLARYARQSIFEWEHRDVRDLQDSFEELVDLIKQENAVNRVQEDQ